MHPVRFAHKAGDKVFQAYARGDRLESRRKLMADWNTFATTGKE
jgi:hypothetical protein